uniref:Uncharacterized protein n=1 Tax=Rhizophora mucronata TaxID=61149 RepID=A0A2P2IY33_RHIMU
MVLFHPKKAF